MKNEKLSFGTKLVFGIGDFYGGASAAIIGLFFLVFMTTVAGINVGIASLIVLSGKAIDAITDPVMGNISDRTKCKLGRRATWFLVGIIPVFLSYVMMWIVPQVSDTLKIAYYFFTYALFSCSFTMVMVPYGSLPQELTIDDAQRSSLVSFRMLFSVIGALTASVVPNIIINSYGQDAQSVKTGYLVMGLIFSAIFALIWIVMFIVMTKKDNRAQTSKTISFTNSLKICLKNKAFLMVCGIYLFSFLPIDITSANFIFFLRYVVDMESSFSLAMGTMMILVAFSLPIYSILVKKFGRRSVFIATSVYRLLALCLLVVVVVLPTLSTLMIAMIFLSFGSAAAYAIPWAMLTEMTDLDVAMTGYRQEGVYSGVMTFIRKLSSGVGIALVGFMLDGAGFIEASAGTAVTQPTSAITMIIFVLTALPMIIVCLGMICGIFYPITQETQKYVRKIVALRSNNEPVNTQHLEQLNRLANLDKKIDTTLQ